MATKKWTPRDCVIKILDASSVTIATTAALDTFFSAGTSIEGYAKNVTITAPESDIELIPLIGETSSIQNAAIDVKPFSLATISGTIIFPGDELLETFALKSGSTSITGSFTRWQYGMGDRNEVAIMVNFDDSTDEVTMAFDDAYVTKLGPATLNADGHLQQEFEIKCLPEDFYVEFKN